MKEYLSLFSNQGSNDSWIDELYEWADRYQIPDLHYIESEIDEDGSVLATGYWCGLTRNRHDLVELEKLNLDGFMQSDIPDQIRYLKKLKILSISDGPLAEWPYEDSHRDINCITDIPEWIPELENLEVLKLSGNSISFVPTCITYLPRLRELYLHNNRIEYVTSELGKLQQLNVLWLGANRTSWLCDSIRSLKNLKELWLDGLPGSTWGPVRMVGNCLEIITEEGYSKIELNNDQINNVIDALDVVQTNNQI